MGWVFLIFYCDTGRPHFTALHFIVLCRYCIFYKLKVCGLPALSSSVGAIFPAAFVHFVSLSHLGNFHNISSFIITIIRFVVVICDQ